MREIPFEEQTTWFFLMFSQRIYFSDETQTLIEDTNVSKNPFRDQKLKMMLFSGIEMGHMDLPKRWVVTKRKKNHLPFEISPPI